MGEIHTSVVITIFNRKKLFRRTLEAYKRFGKHENTELVLVEEETSPDPCNDLVKDFLQVFERVQYVKMDKRKSTIPIYFNCPALGINIGIRNAVGKLIIKTDPECLPLADNIHLMQQTFAYGTRRMYTFGRTLMGTEWFNDAMERTGFIPLTEGEMMTKYPAAHDRVLISETGCRGPWWYYAGWLKADHEMIGGVDEEFLRGFAGDDDDHAERMNRCGVPLHWDDRMCVLHQYHTPPIHQVEKSRHEHNKARLLDGRLRGRIKVNDTHQWGGDNAVVSKELFG